MENLTNLSQYPQRLLYYFGEVRHGLKAAILVTMVALLALVLLFKKVKTAAGETSLCLDSLVVILPAFVTLPVVAILSPVLDQRYIYNIVPFFVVAVCLLLYWLRLALEGRERSALISKAVLLAIAALALWQARCVPPAYLYPEYRD